MKKDDKEKNTLLKLWENPQSKAGIKLLLYFVFIALVVLAINNAKNYDYGNDANEEKITIGDMKDKLLEGVYQYEYIVVYEDLSKEIYKGSKTKDSDEGTKETKEKITKYYIDNTGIFELVLGDKVAIENLYGEIDSNFLDIEYIFDFIKDKSTSIVKKDDTKEYNYSFLINDDECDIILRVKNEEIYNIYITYNKLIYDLSFSNIGNIK